MSKDLQVRAAPGYSPGYAWIEAGATWADGAHVIIRRVESAKAQYLGENDWQDERVEIQVIDQDTHGAVTHLLLGPYICDKLQPHQWLDITVVEGAHRHLFEAVIWPGSRSLSNPYKPQEVRRVAHQKLDTGPKVEGGESNKKVNDEDSSGGESTGGEHEKKEDNHEEHEDKRPRRFPWWLVILFVLVLGGGAAAYYWQNVMGCSLWPFSCSAGATADESAQEGTPPPEAVAPTPPEEEAPAPVADGPEQWRATIANPASTEAELLELARRLREDPTDAVRSNIGYDALYAAATNQNSLEARKLIANANDPLNPSVAPEAANPRTALTYYRMAADAGDTDSADKLEALCGWVAGQSGDALREAMEVSCD